jgi:hypothetical protein
MGNWYRVTKRINGRLYDYWQRTYRVVKSVKTENKYIGPAGSAAVHSAGTRAACITPPTCSISAPTTPEDAIWQLNPVHNPDGVDLRQYKKFIEQERREDEHIQYGNLKDRIARQEAAVRKAKRKAKGIKAANPFLAQLLKKE